MSQNNDTQNQQSPQKRRRYTRRQFLSQAAVAVTLPTVAPVATVATVPIWHSSLAGPLPRMDVTPTDVQLLDLLYQAAVNVAADAGLYALNVRRLQAGEISLADFDTFHNDEADLNLGWTVVNYTGMRYHKVYGRLFGRLLWELQDA